MAREIRKLRKRATDRVLVKSKSEAGSLELLRSTVPHFFQPQFRDGSACLWLATIRYIEHLTGTTTRTGSGGPRDNTLRVDDVKNCLTNLIPGTYIFGGRKTPKGKMLAAAAVAYIENELVAYKLLDGTEAKSKRAKRRSALRAAQDAETNSTEMSENAEENTGFISAVLTLRIKILAYRKLDIDLDDPYHAMIVASRMITELQKGADDIKKFGARGDGDFEKLAWAVYSLRTYFIDEVDDDSSIDNLLGLVRLALQLANELLGASQQIKACIGAAPAQADRVFTHPSSTGTTLVERQEPIEIQVPSMNTKPLRSFSFCSSGSLSEASGCSGQSFLGPDVAASVYRAKISTIKPQQMLHDHDMTTVSDLAGRRQDWQVADARSRQSVVT